MYRQIPAVLWRGGRCPGAKLFLNVCFIGVAVPAYAHVVQLTIDRQVQRICFAFAIGESLACRLTGGRVA